MKNKLLPLIKIVLIIMIPFISFGQTPGPGDGGPEAVPFDDNMNLLFLVAGIAFAVLITLKNYHNKSTSLK